VSAQARLLLCRRRERRGDPPKLEYIYPNGRTASWNAARKTVFSGGGALMRTFASDAMAEA
jgi:hypothetical protein